MRKINSCLFAFVMFVALTAVLTPAQATSADPQRGYLLGPGDEITVKVLGEPQFDFIARIDDDGKIQVPFFDTSVVGKCRAEADLRNDVTKMLAKYLRSPQVSLRVTERRSIPPATISGEVRQPQQVVLMRKARLVEMVSLAGDPTENASGMIQVFRTQRPMCPTEADNDEWKAIAGTEMVPSRLYSLSSVRSGKEDSNPVIYPGDVIVVQKASPVYITGEVRSPQGVYIQANGLSLTQALAMVGGITREAKTKDIKIYRQKANSQQREVIAVNYDQIKAGAQEDKMLEPYDIIEVDKSKKNLGQTVMEMVVGAGKSVVSSATGGIGYRILY
jgi:polysaccharide export outer membrane protein